MTGKMLENNKADYFAFKLNIDKLKLELKPNKMKYNEIK